MWGILAGVSAALVLKRAAPKLGLLCVPLLEGGRGGGVGAGALQFKGEQEIVREWFHVGYF